MNIATTVSALLARWTDLEPTTAALMGRLVSLAVTIGVLLIIYRLLTRLIAHVLRPRADDRGVAARPTRTLKPLLTNIVRWVVAFVALVMSLRELGVDVQAVLVSAGVVGLAVGLGAQSLVRDVITGFFILFEGLIAVGDTIEVGAVRGTVEAIGLRVTKLRMADGALRIIPNGNLTEFANHSRG
jgi:small-conductance mechanosensitive channel